jgi:Zn-dependent M28 family amino/carboxypeptidase
MRTYFLLLAALAPAIAAVAQAPTPAKTSHARVKTTAGRAAGSAAAAPDWSVPYAARITPAGLKADLSVLASDEYAGRATGQKGQQLAATYIAQAFAAAGLTGPVPGSDNPYFQHFALKRTNPAASVKVGDRTFVVGKDYYLLLRNAAALAAPLQPTFVGYGISTAGYADFTKESADLKGKDLVMLLGEPLTKAGQPLLGTAAQPSPYGRLGFTEMMARSPAIVALAPHATVRIAPSAAAFAQVPTAYEHLFDHHEEITLADEPAATGAGANVFIVSPEMGAALLGTTPAGLAHYQQAVAKAGRPIASPFRPVALQAVAKQEAFSTENVLGYLEGSDKKDEVVIVSAHYDHVGVQNGQVYNGADDDGSGTASVLAVARAFAQAKKDGHGPRRSIVFLANVAEEIGLLGSRYYTEHPVLPLASTVAALHIDMLGRVDSLHQGRGAYVYAIGDDWRSPELNALSEATNQQYGPLALDYKYNTPTDPTHLYRRSDHYNFAKHGVPVIYYTSGLHADYHQPTDDVDKIDFPALAQRTQLVFHTAWALAQRDTRLAVEAVAKPVWP